MTTRGIAAFVLLLTLGCGGGGSPTAPQPTPTPIPTPTPSPVRTVLIGAERWSLPADFWFPKNLDFPPVGTIDASIDWTGGSNADIYAVDSSCANPVDLLAGRCTVLAKNETVGQNPKSIAFQSVANRIYTFYVHNTSSGQVSGEIHVGVTTFGPSLSSRDIKLVSNIDGTAAEPWAAAK